MSPVDYAFVVSNVALIAAAGFAAAFSWRRKPLRSTDAYFLWRVVLLIGPGVLVASLALSATGARTIPRAQSLNMAANAGHLDRRIDGRSESGYQTLGASLPPLHLRGTSLYARLTPLRKLMSIAWLAVAVLGFLRIGLSLYRAQRILRTSTRLTPDVASRIPEWAAGLPVRLSAQISTPMVLGVFRPALLLPPALLPTFSDEALMQVLRHENLHYRSRDNVSILVEQLAAALFWCNPIIGSLLREISFYRELRCDEVACGVGTRAVYMKSLLATYEAVVGRKQLAAAITHSSLASGTLARRMSSIASLAEGRALEPWALATLAAFVLFAFADASLYAPRWSWPDRTSKSTGRVMAYFMGDWTCYAAKRDDRPIGLASFSPTAQGMIERNTSVGGTWTYHSTSVWQASAENIQITGYDNLRHRYQIMTSTLPDSMAAGNEVVFAVPSYENTLRVTDVSTFDSVTRIKRSGYWRTVEHAVCRAKESAARSIASETTAAMVTPVTKSGAA
ncbi:MAG: M56 family metallopeptidase [Candidatus Eremiobacteraeota bacterium]|nr:M56 family metallopeptidase [Candidatus Eremiobacteraeota bacterium]